MEENTLDLERILEGTMKPTNLSLETLRKITDDFSQDRIIAEGGFGTVYKGVIGNGIIVAVKRIRSSMTINQKLFRREVDSLMEVNHPNVVRFLGLCSHTVEIPMKNPECQGYIFAERRERLLCFEYVSNGSLDKYITDELRGLEWDTRYQIIKGICAGLDYLHKEKRILHMDLKPANILLDNQMVPKITDFGLSRPVENSQTMTANHFSSPGYAAPENLFGRGTMSVKSDMYSLGVIIIELVTGCKDIPDNNNILRRWRHRWSKSVKETPLEYHHQVTGCIEIGSQCLNLDAYARPCLSQILSKFVEFGNTKINLPYWEDDMLGVEPLELKFGYNKKQQILSCSVELSNNTDCSIAFEIQTTSVLPYFIEPNKDIVKPRSKYSMDITLPIASTEDHKAALQYSTSNKQYSQEFIVRSIKVNEGLTTKDINQTMFDKHTESEHVDEIRLAVISEEPCNEEEENAPNELHQNRLKAPGETSSEVVESWRKKLEKSQSDVQLKQVQVSTEIGIECTDFSPAKRTHNRINRLNETESLDEYIETGVITLQQEENSLNELHQDGPKAPEETSSEDLSFYRSSNLLLGQKQPEHVPAAVFLAVMKIGFFFADEATRAIISKLSYKVTNLKELPVKAMQIEKQLRVLSNVIRQIGMVYLRDEVVNRWIGEVRRVAYHVEDIMDKCSYHVLQYQEEGIVDKFFTRRTHNYVKVFSEITEDVVEVEREIQLVIQMKDQLQPSQLVANPLTEMERHRFQDSFPEFVKDDDLVGIEDNRILLIGWLYSVEQENTVITVSGMGGLGKSTLVSNVYDREKFNFDAHAWIGVSQIYTVDALLRNLVWKIIYTEQTLSVGIDKMDVYDLQKAIQQGLKNRKYLIVLDDVWEQDVYFHINNALQGFQNGSRLIITTRNDHVAGISSPSRRLELQPLSHPDAFDLFCKRAFFQTKGHMCPKELETIATAIVDMCHGLPLAIVTIGSMLCSRQWLDIWIQTYNQLGSVLSNNDHVRAILNLSYYDLSEDLRCCFLYCSMFPEEHPMSRYSLVRLWVSEGLVVCRGNKTPEMVAEGNLMELIHRNMLQVVENDELGRVKTCKIHSIVRDLAISVAEEERFASANDHGTVIRMDKCVRRLSLCEWKDSAALEVKLPHLRTLVSIGGVSSSPGMLSSILSNSRYLTVLELQDSEVSEVPSLIGNLFNLRYIGLQRTKVKSLPDSIENLSNLLTLDIKQTKIEKLPRGVVKLKKLRHLLADRYNEEKNSEFPCFIGVQAPEKLSHLEELQTLETVKSSNGLAEQLKKLMQLKSVSIENISASDCANLFATLSDMRFLSRLLLSARDELCFEAFKPQSTVLHRLIIRGRLAKGTLSCPIFLHHGTQLKYLALSWCDIGEDPLMILAPHLPNLAYLELTNMHSATTLVISEDHFPILKTLVLKHMPDVRELNITDGAIPHIESLYITSLPKMDRVPRGIESLRCLKKLWLLDLHRNFISKWVANRNIMHHKFLHIPEVRI